MSIDNVVFTFCGEKSMNCYKMAEELMICEARIVDRKIKLDLLISFFLEVEVLYEYLTFD